MGSEVTMGKFIWNQGNTGARSLRRFRFGIGQNYPPMGSVLLNDTIDLAGNTAAAFVLDIDLADPGTPFLESRRSLSTVRAKVDFEHNQIETRKATGVPFPVSQGGHILLKLYPRRIHAIRTSSSDHIYASSSLIVDQDEEEAEVAGGNTEAE